MGPGSPERVHFVEAMVCVPLGLRLAVWLIYKVDDWVKLSR